MTVVGEAEVVGAVRSLVDRLPPSATDPHEFLAARFDAGLAWVFAPPGLGGLGAPAGLQPVVEDVLAEAGAPVPGSLNPIGVGMAAPTLLAHGSDAQRARYLRPLFSGTEVWCQLFSEPSVGSDLAGLATIARPDGDEWTVDGQKVWTSLAHLARWGLLLARTDPDVPKHNGLTYFVIDMQAPGVEVRPLRQMTGEAEFNEIYLTGARIPDAERLGAVGDGWRVATTTLMNERVSIGSGSLTAQGAPGADLLDAYRAAAAKGLASTAARDRTVRIWTEANVNRLTTMRAAASGNRGDPGPEGSILKLAGAEYARRSAELVLDLLGAEGTVGFSFEMARPGLPMGAVHGDPRKWFLRSRAQTIEGGTSEILRNVLGERVLGLPADIRVDKGIPWREVPRTSAQTRSMSRPH